MRRESLPDFAVDADIARAWTLPAALYTDAAVYEAERERMFAHTWQVAGRHEEAAKPGDYFTTEIAGEPLLICRDGEHKLRAFYNVCRHRAGPPAEGCGSRKVFRCAYHGKQFARHSYSTATSAGQRTRRAGAGVIRRRRE